MALPLLFRGLLNLLKLPFLPLWWLLRTLGRPRGRWLHVRVRRRLVEIRDPRRALLQRLVPSLAESRPTSLEALRRLAAHAVRDQRVQGVVFTLPTLMVGWATAKALRDVMASLREKGKRVAVFLPEGGSHKELYVASAADTVIATPQATLLALGLAAQSRYLKSLLDKVGIEVERFARAEFKTAAENLAQESMSEPQREQLGALLDAIDGELRAGLAERPRADEVTIERLFEAGFLRGTEAVAHGVIDDVAYEDELAAKLQPGVAKPRLASGPRYLAFHEARFFRRMLPAKHFAMVPVHGPITSGRRAERAIAALRIARKNPRVKGVVLHVDSPGGSATVSDLIHREVTRVMEKKPVVACFGNVAASGGYYVAAGTSAIVAQPTTVTGSIGVVSARFVATDLLTRLGIKTEVIRKAPHADMFSPARPLEDSEREILDREMESFYRDFVALVARGRGKTDAEIEPLARGRVWAGIDAHERGLVDRLGGLDAALAELRERVPASDGLPLRLLVPRTTQVPAEPSLPEAAEAALASLAPDAATLLRLARGPDRILFLAPDVPDVS